MRKLTIVTGLIGALYSGYWYAASSAVQNGAQGAIDQLAEDGWEVSYASLATTGFPIQFSTVLTDARLSPPDASFAWVTPEMEVRAASYAPNTIIADFPATQVIEIGGQPVQIDAADLQASIRSGVATSLPLQDARITSGPMTLSAEGDRMTMQDAVISFSANEGGTALYDMNVVLNTITLPQAALQALDGTQAPETLDQLRMTGQIAYDRPIDRFLGDGDPLRPTLLRITDLALDWGAISIGGTMDVTIDSTGAPTGAASLSVENWEQALDIAATAGLVPPEFVGTLRNTAQMLAGGDANITVDITFDDGTTRMGFIPLPSLRFFGPD